MSQRLPELIEPDRLAESGRSLAGTIAISKMKRLMPLLYLAPDNDADNELDNDPGNAGDANVSLEFGIDETGQVRITGTVETEIKLQCQRCMQQINYHIAENISLAVIHNSQLASEIASHYEPLVVEEEMVSLPELIEDEILLALPAVPLHEPDECKPIESGEPAAGANSNRSDTGVHSEKKNPFAVLEQLRKKD